MELHHISPGKVSDRVTAQSGLEVKLHCTLVVLNSSRFAVVRDVLTQETVGKFRNCDGALLPVALCRGVFSAKLFQLNSRSASCRALSGVQGDPCRPMVSHRCRPPTRILRYTNI